MVTTANMISYAISILAVLITIFTLVKNGTKEDNTVMTTVVVKLENIEKGVSDIQRDQRDMRDEIKDHTARIVKIESFIKQFEKQGGIVPGK